jgi:hypothetical protein
MIARVEEFLVQVRDGGAEPEQIAGLLNPSCVIRACSCFSGSLARQTTITSISTGDRPVRSDRTGFRC